VIGDLRTQLAVLGDLQHVIGPKVETVSSVHLQEISECLWMQEDSESVRSVYGGECCAEIIISGRVSFN
jgi:hypothetical protein